MNCRSQEFASALVREVVWSNKQVISDDCERAYDMNIFNKFTGEQVIMEPDFGPLLAYIKVRASGPSLSSKKIRECSWP